MTDFNINAKSPPDLSLVNEVTRKNLTQLPQSNKISTISTDNSEKRQEISSETLPSDPLSKMPKEKLDETISQLNSSLQNIQRNLEFSVDEDIGRIIINVKDREADEVVRQIPTEEVLELAKNLHAASERLSESIDSGSQAPTEGVFLSAKV
jgi:flagellar protein FlaG